MRDIDIRCKLKESILKKYYDDPSSKVVEEMNVCHGINRVDIAVINGSLHGFEIKSDSDNLNRLPDQLNTYSKIFDYLTVVCGEKHLTDVTATIPEWCGIITANYKKSSEGLKLNIIRKAQKNCLVDNYSVAQLLWKDEALDILFNMGAKKGLSNKPKPFLWDTLSQLLSTERLSEIVRTKLKTRLNWRSE